VSPLQIEATLDLLSDLHLVARLNPHAALSVFVSGSAQAHTAGFTSVKVADVPHTFWRFYRLA